MNETLMRYMVMAQYAAVDLAARLKKPARGQGMVEYALILGLIAIAAIVAVKVLSNNAQAAFTHIGNCVNNAQTPTPPGVTPTAGC